MSHRHSNKKKEKSTYKDVDCDGYACSSRASNTLSISAGIFGQVELHLCATCQQKFVKKTEGENYAQGSPSSEIHIRNQHSEKSFQDSSNATSIENTSKLQSIKEEVFL